MTHPPRIIPGGKGKNAPPPLVVWQHDSMESLFQSIDAHRFPVGFTDKASHATAAAKGVTESLDWQGGVRGGAQGFARFVRDGWAKGAAALRESMGAIPNPPPALCLKRKQRWTPDDGDLDYIRFREYEWDRMYRGARRETSLAGRDVAVRLSVAIHGHCGIDPEAFVWRGAVACLVAETLEDAGYRVAIEGYEQSSGTFQDAAGREHGNYFSVRVKDYDDGLDVPRVAACLAHASMLRVALFAARACVPLTLTYGYGRPEHGAPKVPDESGAPTIVIDHCFDVQAARSLLAKILSDFQAPNGDD